MKQEIPLTYFSDVSNILLDWATLASILCLGFACAAFYYKGKLDAKE